MPLYKITVKGEETPRLVKAKTKPGAINHVLKGFIVTADAIEAEDVYELASAGIVLEDASATESGDPAPPTDDKTPPKTDTTSE